MVFLWRKASIVMGFQGSDYTDRTDLIGVEAFTELREIFVVSRAALRA